MLPDGWFTNENIKEYRRLVNNMPDNGVLVELGVWKGKSLCSIADIIIKKNIKVFAVDTFKGSDSEGDRHKYAKENNLREEFEKNIKDFGLDIFIYEMTTDEASKNFDLKIDLLFIDAGHTYEDVKSDIANWYPKVIGTIAGHDYSKNWAGVVRAVDEQFKYKKIVSDIWSFNTKGVLAYVSTYNRYDTTLPITLLSIANQTHKPEHFILYDDNENKKDLRDIEVYQNCFKMFDEKGISWEVVFGESKGQHFNHEKANMLGLPFCWRIDDDEMAEANCLEVLFKKITLDEKIGAVGGLVKMPNNPVKSGNIQWYDWEGEDKEVNDLYSSFIYRSNIAHFDLRLSPVAHREETMFSMSLKNKGYKLYVTNKAITWHFRSLGGIRSGQEKEMFDRDEDIFKEWLKNYGNKIYILNNGLGDHYMFLQAIKPSFDSIIAVCYPEPFNNLGYKTISIAEAQCLVDIKDYDIYKWCFDNKWTGHLIDAFKKMYENTN
jgi:hypothetical protein